MGLRRLALFGLIACLWAGAAEAGTLRVVATVPDLGDLLRQVGGDEVDVFVLVRGPQDPHFVEARPSFIQKLHRADLLVVDGLDLEVGWLPALQQAARNAAVAAGGPGYLDASTAITPLGVPTGPVDRSMGDVHPYGNPHYLGDPINGLRVARLLRDTLADLRPEAAAGFQARYRDFAERLMERLVGRAVLDDRDPEDVARQVVDGTLPADAPLGGWLGALRPAARTKAVQDHAVWLYFARRMGLVLVDSLEPRPGIAPTTRHLAEVVERIEKEGVRLILSSAYFDPRHARWIAERTDARVVEMAHQVGSREGADDYLSTIDLNVRGVLAALAAGQGG